MDVLVDQVGQLHGLCSREASDSIQILPLQEDHLVGVAWANRESVPASVYKSLFDNHIIAIMLVLFVGPSFRTAPQQTLPSSETLLM